MLGAITVISWRVCVSAACNTTLLLFEAQCLKCGPVKRAELLLLLLQFLLLKCVIIDLRIINWFVWCSSQLVVCMIFEWSAVSSHFPTLFFSFSKCGKGCGADHLLNLPEQDFIYYVKVLIEHYNANVKKKKSKPSSGSLGNHTFIYVQSLPFEVFWKVHSQLGGRWCKRKRWG